MRVFILVAMTADGFIGQDKTHLATTWTTREDKVLFTRMSKEAGTLVMGENTFLTFGTPLKDRRLIVYTKQHQKIAAMGVETTEETPEALVRRLEMEGVESLAICGGTTIYTMFMKAGLAQELYVNMHAVVFGKGVPLFNEAVNVDVSLVSAERLGDSNTLMHYQVHPK